MKLLILGGGKAQISAIKKAKLMGYEVIVSDYLKDAPGKKYADYNELVSTFDIEGNLKVARKYNIDGIMTIGTDQPVYTAAFVADKLNLPSMLDKNTAYAVTNKKKMKNIFNKYNIPTVEYRIIKENFELKEIRNLNLPVVLKPLDSQGQRGIFKLNSKEEVKKYFKKTIKYSREEEILIEEYYKSDEITVSGWVDNSKLHILTVTDRITYENSLNIGICTAHLFPSKFFNKYYDEIKNISKKIVSSFNIKNGPIYFQMLVGDKGVKVNEIACRIGGAYEADFMPLLTNIDILEMTILKSLGNKINSDTLSKYNIFNNNKWLSVQLFFANKGKVNYVSNKNNFKKIKGLIQIDINYKKGDIIPEIENATARAGHFIVEANNKRDLIKRINHIYDRLKMLDENCINLVKRKAGEII